MVLSGTSSEKLALDFCRGGFTLNHDRLNRGYRDLQVRHTALFSTTYKAISCT